MRYWTDLHIHSSLSPCADEDMTPNNIVNMAFLKGLDIIAITDHNSTKNAGAIMELGKETGLLVVPGMELCTAEEIHMICLFPNLFAAQGFEKIVYENLPPVRNQEDIFGSKIIMDAQDHEIGRDDRLLSGACGLDVETAIQTCRNLGGIIFPAHVNRESYSMLNTLGAIPKEYGFHHLECSKNCVLNKFLQENTTLASYEFIRSSDAHFLSDILEQEEFLELEDKSIEALFCFLQSLSVC